MDSKAIVLRLKKVLLHYSLTSSTFADSIDVQRSSISHLMSGRNKPSLDFVLKIVNKYPEVDLYWLLNGKGNFPKENETPTVEKEKVEAIEPTVKKVVDEIQKPTPSLFSQTIPEKKIIEKTIVKEKPISFNETSINSKKLIKVVLLYNDGSFEEYNK